MINPAKQQIVESAIERWIREKGLQVKYPKQAAKKIANKILTA